MPATPHFYQLALLRQIFHNEVLIHNTAKMKKAEETNTQTTAPPDNSGNTVKILLGISGCVSLVLLVIIVVLLVLLAGRPANTTPGDPPPAAPPSEESIPGEMPGDDLIPDDAEPPAKSGGSGSGRAAPPPGSRGVSEDELPEIFFTPGGLFDDALREEFRQRYVLPMVLWEKDQGNQPLVVEVSENPYEETSATYPYGVSLFQLGGFYSGWAIELTGSGEVPLFIPECFESYCDFSDEFEDRFPENVEAYDDAVRP